MSVQDTQSADLASFEAIRAYDWAADQEFQAGLQSILSSASSPEQAATLTLQAKCFFYSKKSGIHIDYDALNIWLAQQEPTAATQTETEPKPVLTGRNESASILGRPSIDTTNPVISSENFPNNAPAPWLEQTEEDSTPGAPTPGKVEAPYPTSFAHIVELITTGQPIPGIREIPNVLNTAPPSEATKPKRQKPWEAAVGHSNGNSEAVEISSSSRDATP